MNKSWQTQLDQLIDSNRTTMIALRRQLHQHPEPSGEEQETSRYLSQQLQQAGFQVRLGHNQCGVIADADYLTESVTATQRGRIALRADIDALRIHDAKEVQYRSQHDGIMHACGHDAHTTIVFSAISALQQMHEQQQLPWPVQVRAIFQPAEEIAQGARQMIQEGALEEVAAILATHMDPTRETGRIGLKSGTLTAMCDTITVTVHGRAGHGARPHEARDPIAAAAQFLTALYQSVPRQSGDDDTVVASFGEFQGGQNANVIPNRVTLRGTLRTLTTTARETAQDKIQQLGQGIGEATETRFEIEFGRGCESVKNDQSLVQLLAAAATEVLADDSIESIATPSMGSEDFAFYCQQIPAAMFRLGSASGSKHNFPLHSAHFDITEESLLIGAKILAHAVILWSAPD